ncbi:MAG TPA: phosphoglucosamine mutase [Gammaproteobacteria bacterium]|jgi:phosphoglucosamine mutase|nr:phosphoglucosamine mutase [Gammaproteobacteria bacterium]HIF87299.1 phosphoglucosamine mutase [Gammaproteobacteria bacterium]HIL63520.1 phosphoglucosamine mutase [Porticoccaceae bacterium]HIN90286.1 phosphoglucosamine mutase [Porticoccaceae bacterium]|tara:strand:- start:1514 stop:2869 length:1356 start_codon:yes stop_codon:yes gene_type:complete
MQSKTKKYFGTDGIRGTVGTAPITPDFMLKLGWAAGKVFAREGNGRNKILIGKDTRISGYMFEAALEAGVTAAGVDINLLGPMPTPAIAYLTRTLRAQAGIVISASHNAFEDNGIKFFSSEGSKLADNVEYAIEEELAKNVSTVTSDLLGKASRIADAAGRYIEFCKSTIGTSLKFNGLKIVVDCAHGSTYHIAPSVFEELGAKVVAIGVAPDGLNINEQCGSTSPDLLVATVLAEQADLGIAFDGDGDRLVMVDHLGNVVDGDELLYVIASEKRRQNIDFGGVVGTAMSNLGLELALDALDVPFTRTAVGDRYVMKELLERGWDLGGESSGHIICLDKTTTGDGIVSALQALAAIVNSEQALADLKSKMNKFPQSMINVKLVTGIDISANEIVQTAVSDVESQLGKNGRVLLRPSGTEPVVRVMVEGEDFEVVDKLAKELSAVVASELGS